MKSRPLLQTLPSKIIRGAVIMVPLKQATLFGLDPEFQRWQEFMRPGEIWSMVGEEWVRDPGARTHA